MTFVIERLVRGLFWVLLHTIYRVRVVGRRNVPPTGAALIVCNHVSWLDGLFIAMSLRRPIRLLVWAPFTKTPVLRWLLALGRCIPIDSDGGPRGIVRALREASDALANGELVGIFAEGSITRTGFTLPFHRGFEQIVKKTPVPIIPACLDRLWGSIFSYQGGRMLWKWPQRIPYPVTAAFGTPLPPNTKVWEVRQAVQILLADCLNLRKKKRKPVHRQFVRIACRHPFRPCLIDPLHPPTSPPSKGGERGGRVLNYGQTLTGVVLLSRKLRPLLGDDRMIGLWLPTTLGGALANMAVTFLGKVAVNLNYTASTEAVLSAIKQCDIRRVVTARAFCERVPLPIPSPILGEGSVGGPDVELIYLEDLAKAITKFQRIRTYLGIVCLPGFVTEYVSLRLGRHRSDDLATIIFSSGTTGDPKGIILSQNNIASNIESMVQAIDLVPADRLLAVLPFFHSFGYTVTLWLPLLFGASIVYFPDPRQAKEIGEICQQFRCSLFLSTATFLRFCIRRCGPDDFKTVRLIMCGAEKLPQPLAQEFEEKFGVLPLEGYGCTELSPVAATNVPDWEENGHRQIGTKPGTIGQPIPGVAAKIVDPNTFAPLPPGQAGMLLIYGPNVMLGYLNRPEATAEAIHNGWYITGDIARMDEDGFITITDRLSRFSKIGGEMVPHQRVEDEIHSILGTNERVVAVAGVPDERKGERLVVLHTPLDGHSIQEIHQKLTNSGLPNLWLPSPKSYFQVPELPILGSGKLDIQQVKKMASELVAKSGG